MYCFDVVTVLIIDFYYITFRVAKNGRDVTSGRHGHAVAQRASGGKIPKRTYRMSTASPADRRFQVAVSYVTTTAEEHVAVGL